MRRPSFVRNLLRLSRAAFVVATATALLAVGCTEATGLRDDDVGRPIDAADPAFSMGPPNGFPIVTVTHRAPPAQQAGGPRVSSLAAAIERVQPGGIIRIDDGDWETGGVVIDRPVRLEPAPGASPLLVNNGTANGLTIAGVESGTVELVGLRFLNAAGRTAIAANGVYDRVVVRDAVVTVTSPSTTTAYGIRTLSDEVDTGWLIVENVTFEGGRYGVLITAGQAEVTGSRFREHSVAAVQFTQRSRGAVRDNDINGCGTNACIQAGDPDGIVIENNRIEHPVGFARNGIRVLHRFAGEDHAVIRGNEVHGTGVQSDAFASDERPLNASGLRHGIIALGVHAIVEDNRVSGAHWGISHQRRSSGRITGNHVSKCGWVCIAMVQPSAPSIIEHNTVEGDVSFRRVIAAIRGESQGESATITIRDNVIASTFAGDRADARNYGFELGILAMSWEPSRNDQPRIAGVPVEVYGNSIADAGFGLVSFHGGSMNARDNTVTGVSIGVSAWGAVEAIDAQRNDILDAHVGVAGDGDVLARCNWWGSIHGPSNPRVAASQYTPVAVKPIANRPEGACVPK